MGTVQEPSQAGAVGLGRGLTAVLVLGLPVGDALASGWGTGLGGPEPWGGVCVPGPMSVWCHFHAFGLLPRHRLTVR